MGSTDRRISINHLACSAICTTHAHHSLAKRAKLYVIKAVQPRLVNIYKHRNWHRPPTFSWKHRPTPTDLEKTDTVTTLQGTQLHDWAAKYSDSHKCLFSLLIHSTRDAESLFFRGTQTPTPGLEKLGLQTSTPTLGPKSHYNSDSKTYCVT